MLSPAPRRDLRILVVLSMCCCGAAAAAAATLQLAGPPGAAVRLGDRDVGLLPLPGPLELAPGVYRLECRARGYEDLSQTVVVSEPDSWLHLRLRPLPLSRSQAVSSSLLFAGLGQWYQGATVRGWVYLLGESGGLVAALAGELQRTNDRDDYMNAKAAYDAAVAPNEIAFWRAQADQAYRDMDDMASLRDTGLYVAAGAYVLSLLDAWLLFPSVDIGPGTVVPDAHGAVPAGPTLAGIHAAVTVGF
ncbi:MAG TPA: hypothetical protein PLL30_02260 [Candidatus Krumholzibacteria bacterium]|nr:hypothetical protein [Candidatus Krumholzibacteria bacterium]HPD70591.1 hypothetical protein [Candidatus Krumholzibacteria bacterium]HRY39709.1 hypothetical protein [Candidatus Krumholzibacteria bacterium]